MSLKDLPPERIKQLVEMRERTVWLPQIGPQCDLMASEADQVLFGGACGGGKSDALLGVALTKHHNSLLLRREFKQLLSLNDRVAELLGSRDGYHAGEQRWSTPDGRTLELGSCPDLGSESKYQGRAKDALLIDETVHFHDSQIVFLSSWLRSTDAKKQPQLIMASNPPVGGQGLWLASWYRPWLDPQHPNPAASGEIRYFANLDGQVKEVDGPGKIQTDRKLITPFSRQFISSRLRDNKYLARTGYEDRLDHLPQELREALLEGNFYALGGDVALQVIPSAWVRAAMDRWTTVPPTSKISSIGVDVSRGGKDRTVIYVRRRGYYDQPIILQGEETKTGGAIAARVLDILGDNETAPVVVDIIGVGSSPYDILESFIGGQAVPFNSSHRATRTDATGAAMFRNMRSQAWWKFAEALNPEYSRIALPPSTELFSELTSATYSLASNGIAVEGKEQQIKRLGRSPDLADACIMAHHGSPMSLGVVPRVIGNLGSGRYY